MHTIDFHAHHSPLGAYATFTCGRFGAGGGPTIEGSLPTTFDLSIGYADEAGEMYALPFFRSAGATEVADFVATSDTPAPRRRHSLPGVTRAYERGTDTWSCPGFSFSLFTPVVPIPNPEAGTEAELARALLPVVTARLTLDNRLGIGAKKLVFAIDTGRACRFVEGVSGARAVGWGHEIAIAALDAPGLESWVEWSELDFLAHGRSHLLGRSCGFTLEVPAGETRQLDLVIGFCRAGAVTSGLDCRYLYTRYFSTIEAVLEAGVARFSALVSAAKALDRTLATSGLDEHRRFLFAHAERSYWGNTQLLEHDGKPLWVVLEGEYTMMNTFDLTIDMCFYELMQNPWTVKNVLDQFVERYSYTDELARPRENAARTRHSHSRDPHELGALLPAPAEIGLPGGISFTHDMGVCAQFTPPEHSSYELPGLGGCFSYMTGEELLNWVLTAVTYVEHTGDEAWSRARADTFRACLVSLEQRDDPEPTQRTGLQNLDSSRCGGGWEITTYDSLDSSLGQARRNLYLGVKAFAAWLGLSFVFTRLAEPELAERAHAGAKRAAHTIAAAFSAELGFIPAVLEPGNTSAILPAIEGLIFPWFWGKIDVLRRDSAFAPLFAALADHLRRVLAPDLCLFPDGGWKLSSTSDNSWLSKIFLCQIASEQVFGVVASPESHAAHARWQQIGSADFAFSDQCISGVAQGSKYYPRGVTAALWLSSMRRS